MKVIDEIKLEELKRNNKSERNQGCRLTLKLDHQ